EPGQLVAFFVRKLLRRNQHSSVVQELGLFGQQCAQLVESPLAVGEQDVDGLLFRFLAEEYDATPRVTPVHVQGKVGNMTSRGEGCALRDRIAEGGRNGLKPQRMQNAHELLVGRFVQ